jgi:hypothetical protein
MRHLSLGLLLLFCFGCGGLGGSSGVTLRFANQRPATAGPGFGAGLGLARQALNERAPTVYGAKLLAVYLAEDVDPATQNNLGATEMIYLNPACQGDISHCELSEGVNEQDGLPFTHLVTEYFDFAADSATVNAAISAQQLQVAAGTYRYARMEFCKRNLGNAYTMQWAADGAAPTQVVSNQCGVTSAVFDPPLTIAAGDAVAVTLSYDLAGTVSDLAPGQGGGGFCVGGTCFTPPPFVPSASKLP